jgi:hypothetical protein
MDKIINKSIEEYLTKYKMDIRNKMMELKFSDDEKKNQLLEFVFDYNRLTIKKEELKKPTRLKTIIPPCLRCSAKRVNGEQCTRRKNKEGEYCGTHSKVLPYGVFDVVKNDDEVKKNLNVVAENIQGIMYYIDSFLNVYNTEDILEGKEDPRIVAKAEKNNNKYTIPELGLV